MKIKPGSRSVQTKQNLALTYKNMILSQHFSKAIRFLSRCDSQSLQKISKQEFEISQPL
jgi:hypothetical protein